MADDHCSEMHLLIQAGVDGELEPADAARVEEHLGNCPACTEMQDEILALSGQLKRAMPRVSAPAALRTAVRARIADAEPRQAATRRPRLLGTSALGLAVAASLAAVAILPRGDHTSESVVAAHVRALQPDHLIDVASTDQHTVKPWFNGRLAFSPPVKDLSGKDFTLVGGRLDYLPDQPAATLVYKRRQHVIDLFVWPTAGAGQAAEASGTHDGYNYFSWRQGGMTFWAVSDLNTTELQEFCSAWR